MVSSAAHGLHRSPALGRIRAAAGSSSPFWPPPRVAWGIPFAHQHRQPGGLRRRADRPALRPQHGRRRRIRVQPGRDRCWASRRHSRPCCRPSISSLGAGRSAGLAEPRRARLPGGRGASCCCSCCAGSGSRLAALAGRPARPRRLLRRLPLPRHGDPPLHGPGAARPAARSRRDAAAGAARRGARPRLPHPLRRRPAGRACSAWRRGGASATSLAADLGVFRHGGALADLRAALLRVDPAAAARGQGKLLRERRLPASRSTCSGRRPAREIVAVFSRIDRANAWAGLDLSRCFAAAGAALLGRDPAAFGCWRSYPFLHLGVYAAIGSDPGFGWHLYLLGPFLLIFGAALAS